MDSQSLRAAASGAGVGSAGEAIACASAVLAASRDHGVSPAGITWAPSAMYTLYPLYGRGLWLAVTITPAAGTEVFDGKGR